MLSFEQALYFKLLCQSGYKEELDKWLEETLVEEDACKGIILDLAWCSNDLNKYITCLNEYLLDKEIDNIEVCKMLKSFVCDKYDRLDWELEDCVKALYGFAILSEKVDEEGFREMYIIGLEYEEVEEGYGVWPVFEEDFVLYLEDDIVYEYHDWESEREVLLKIPTSPLGVVITSITLVLFIGLFILLHNVISDELRPMIMIPLFILCYLMFGVVLFAIIRWKSQPFYLELNKNYLKVRSTNKILPVMWYNLDEITHLKYEDKKIVLYTEEDRVLLKLNKKQIERFILIMKDLGINTEY